jgi:hypothetical protein
MLGRRKRRHFAAVADKMDQEEAESWKWRQLADEVGDEAAFEKHPRRSAVAIVEELMPLAGNDVARLMEALQVWYDDRTERYKATDEDRSDHVSGLYLSVALNGIGNLFGFVPDGAPAFNEDLARAGRERGWRV